MALDTTGLPPMYASMAQAIYLDDQAKGQAFVTDYLNRQNVLTKSQAAVDTNIAALALPNPTPANTTYVGSAAMVPSATAAQVQAYLRLVDAQTRAQATQINALVAVVRDLLKQNTAMGRLIGNRLDSTSGT